jgi:hypothetical protein
MAKARKSRKRKGAKSRRRAKARPAKRKSKTGAKIRRGAMGVFQEAAALRRRLAGRNTFED